MPAARTGKTAKDTGLDRAEMLSAAERAVGFGVWHWDLETDVVEWSEGLYRVYGLDPESEHPSIERWMDLVHPEDRERVEEARGAAAGRGARPRSSTG